MLTRFEALEIAKDLAKEGLTVNINSSQELVNGWYFPWEPIKKGELWGGSHGVIINKESGKWLQLGSAFPIERDLQAYEDGFTEAVYDLRILSIQGHNQTLDFLQKLRIEVVEPEWKYGTEWLIPRLLDRNELSCLLMNLPRTFRNVWIYGSIEVVQVARQSRYCEFELIPIEIEENGPAHLTWLKRFCLNKGD